MKRYPLYKDSKVKWIGNVPEHWKVNSLKRFLKAPMMYGANESGDNYMPNCPRYIRITDITADGRLKNDSVKTLPMDKAEPYLLRYGDVLFARSGATVGKAYIFKESSPACFAGYLIKAACGRRLSPFYLFYYTFSAQYEYWKNSIFIQSTIQNIGADKYSALPTPVPTEPEQRAIVAFLDRAVEKIDGYIAAKEAEIEKLGTLKQSVIAKAVTQGLNPDAPMKDSGIPWLGNMPEHWGMKRLALQFSEVKENNAKYQYHYAFKFNYGTIVPKAEYGNVDDLRETYEKYTVVHAKDIVINGLNLNYDFISLRVAQVPESGIITSAYLSIRPRVGVNADYYTHFLKSIDSKKVFHGMGTGIRLTLSFGELKKMLIPIPPADEQQTIVDYISRKTQEIDGFITGIRAQIEKLKVYKQRLISDVVTGKICVCDDFLEAN